MADTFTEFLNLSRPEIGASRDAWGEKLNANMSKIDVWAKATDKLAKDALSRITTDPQDIAGVVNFGKTALFREGLKLQIGKNLLVGNGYIYGDQGRTLIAASGNNFEVVNQNNSAYILQANSDGLFSFLGDPVYHAGNLPVANFFDKAKTDRQELNGPFAINMANPYFDLTYGGVMRMRQTVDSNGTWILRNGDNADNFAYISIAGNMWLKSFGDLNTRIETRAAAYADDRLNSAKNYTNTTVANYFPKSGGTVTGEIYSAGRIGTQSGEIFADGLGDKEPFFRLFREGLGSRRLQLLSGGDFAFTRTDNGGSHFFPQDGSISTTQMGDVNTRIENRARAYADDRLASANSFTSNNYIPRSNNGQRMEITNYLCASGSWPFWELLWSGKIRWQIRIADNNELQFVTPDNGNVVHAFRQDGAYTNSSIGEVGSRIESRARAWADTRNLRQTFAGDVHATWNNGSGTFGEPVVNGIVTGVKADNGYYSGLRWRYLQLQGTDGVWYTVNYNG